MEISSFSHLLSLALVLLTFTLRNVLFSICVANSLPALSGTADSFPGLTCSVTVRQEASLFGLRGFTPVQKIIQDMMRQGSEKAANF